MKRLLFITGFSLFVYSYLNAQTFTSLDAFGSDKKIEWTTSTYGNGYGHKIFSSDPGGLTLLNFAARNGTATWTNLMTLTSTGKVGIGTTSPIKLLDVQNTNTGMGDAFIWIKKGIDGTNVNREAGLLIGTNASDYGNTFKIVAKSPNAYFGSPTLNIDFIKSSGLGIVNCLTINSIGNVGIGTTSPDAKLTVKGNIHTNEVKVDLLGAVAPDYVFHKEYDLKSLKAVEDYISSYGHLPNIPSAKDMETDGIMLKEMNLKLLEKIEELTLYAIEQDKKLEAQEARLQYIETLLISKK